MISLLLPAMLSITAALIFYTLGVFAEKRAGILQGWHVLVFCLGFVCDSLGTGLMSRIAGGFKPGLHAVTGALAIILMGIHVLWAVWIWLRGSMEDKQRFHRFSVLVWAVWLIPYILGMFLGMSH